MQGSLRSAGYDARVHLYSLSTALQQAPESNVWRTRFIIITTILGCSLLLLFIAVGWLALARWDPTRLRNQANNYEFCLSTKGLQTDSRPNSPLDTMDTNPLDTQHLSRAYASTDHDLVQQMAEQARKMGADLRASGRMARRVLADDSSLFNTAPAAGHSSADSTLATLERTAGDGQLSTSRVNTGKVKTPYWAF